METATTIQISRELHQRLKVLKDRMGAKSFDELIERLLTGPRRSPARRLGAHPEMKPFAHRDEAHEP